MTPREQEMLQSRFSKVVDVLEEELEGTRAEWRSTTVIVRSLGRNILVDCVVKEIKRVGRLDYNVECFPFMDGFIAVRFAKEEDREAALMNGPWMVAGQLLAMDRWRPNFIPGVRGVDRVVVWLRLVYWRKETILRIAARASNPLALDGFTKQGQRYGFARVKIELDCSSPLKPGTLVRGRSGGVEEPFWQGFIYENLLAPCSKCGRIGHSTPKCVCSSPMDGVAKTAEMQGKGKVAIESDSLEDGAQKNGEGVALEEIQRPVTELSSGKQVAGESSNIGESRNIGRVDDIRMELYGGQMGGTVVAAEDIVDSTCHLAQTERGGDHHRILVQMMAAVKG
ncbi:uncharacterized protein LOC120111705 [Phoenix dactylifera]|uniref:Uncharacterized protein LOC120111705 n=1 Tax=Phoenix dactylifera TaxID=42345 RepID=A0A8B9AI77_PHODC|nr:uncharacterized protein LOC120111705 [Phoenix dactylifera]